MPYRDLASYRRFETHLATNWPIFCAKRSERLRQRGRFGEASERVAENIVEDLFTVALDWKLGDINNQVDYADIGGRPEHLNTFFYVEYR
jgi:orotidine-5'-phosphate decarboxylase